tara:strand:- start:19 stop:312 length:294 start_codon:yes stop_codon:yes gene_type:complete
VLLLKFRVKTPIEKGTEKPSIKRIPKKIEQMAEIIPVVTDSFNKLQKIENLEKPIACRAPNSFMRNENAANNVFNPPIMAPIEIRNAETHAIQRIGV